MSSMELLLARACTQATRAQGVKAHRVETLTARASARQPGRYAFARDKDAFIWLANKQCHCIM
jgi:hypothetical protein